MKTITFKTADDYIAMQPQEIRGHLEKLRHVIRKAAPKAEEVISYNMPAYKKDGMLVYFAAAKNHYALYPTASPIVAFKKELKAYSTSKGTIQFSYDKPLPVKLITAIVKFKIRENAEKKLKKKK